MSRSLILLILMVILLPSKEANALLCSQHFAREALVSLSMVRFMQEMKQTKQYEPDFCESNIHKLLVKANKAGFDLTQAEVLFIIPMRGDIPLLNPKKSIHPEQVPWDYHVVLSYKGRIYDLDYSGTPSYLGNYLQNMFHVSKTNDQGIYFRPIPAKDYLRDFQDHRLFTEDFNSGKLPRDYVIKDGPYYVHESEVLPFFSLKDYINI